MKRKDTYSQGGESPLTPEERRILRASIKEDRSKLPPHDTSSKANTVRFARKNPVFTVCAIIIAAAILLVAVAGAVLLVRKISGGENTSDFTVYLGTESYKADYESLVRDGVLYLDMKKIAKFAGLVVSGSKEKIKFTASAEHYLRFEDKSDTAVINGSRVQMTIPATVNENECLVPHSFLQKALVQGLKIKVDRNTNTIKITRQLYEDTKESADLLFNTDGFVVIQSISTLKKEEIGLDAYNIDITPYLAYIDPESYSDLLILANKQNALGKDYKPTDLIGLTSEEINVPSKDASQQLRVNAAYALKAMLLAMEAANPEIVEELFVTSSYRAYDYQEMLYNRYVTEYVNQGMSLEDAQAEASKTSARPGESEHQTGLCFDFITKSMGGNLDSTFEYTLAFAWLSENAHLYGFILRYPNGMEGVTGYTYEPWHYRFVGRTAAMEIHSSGLTLEEYLELN